MPDAKDAEIHDLRNALMNSQNELLLFRMDVFRVYESLRELLSRYPEKSEKARTAGGRWPTPSTARRSAQKGADAVNAQNAQQAYQVMG